MMAGQRGGTTRDVSRSPRASRGRRTLARGLAALVALAAGGREASFAQSVATVGPTNVVTFGPAVAVPAPPAVAVPALASPAPAFAQPVPQVVPGQTPAVVPVGVPASATLTAPRAAGPSAATNAAPTAPVLAVVPSPPASYPEFAPLAPLAPPANEAAWSTSAGTVFSPAEAIPSYDPLPESGNVRLTAGLSPFSLARRRQELGAAPSAPLPPGSTPVMPTAPLSELAVFSSARPTDPLDNWNPRDEFRTSKAQQFGWTEFVTRHGPLFTAGGGFFEDRAETGWLFEGGIRQPLTHPGRRWVLFGELGGGYHGNLGDGVSQVTSGTFVDPNPLFGLTADLPDFYNTQMTSFRRGIAYGALGFHFQPEIWHVPGRRQVRITSRLGGRVGHLSVTYNQTPTATLQALIDSQTALYGVVGPPFDFIYSTNAKQSDTLVGMFTSTAIGWTAYGVCLGPFCFRELSLVAEVQYGHDWFDLGDYGAGERGLGTVGTLFNINFGY